MTPLPRQSYSVGDRVLIGFPDAPPAARTPAVATIALDDPRRPNVVKVIYEHSRTGAWIARRRILGLAPGPNS
jgi:hypothetical protein